MPTDRLIALLVLTAVAVAVAVVLQRRRPDPPSAPSYRAPAQLDRDDFAGPADQVLAVLFGSTTCDSCPVAWAALERLLAGDDVPPGTVISQRIDVQDEPELHRRYRIDGVPTTLVADRDGVVIQAFFGPFVDADLLAALRTAGVPGAETTP